MTMLNTLPISKIIIKGNIFKEADKISGFVVKIFIIGFLKRQTTEVVTKANIKAISGGESNFFRLNPPFPSPLPASIGSFAKSIYPKVHIDIVFVM